MATAAYSYTGGGGNYAAADQQYGQSYDNTNYYQNEQGYDQNYNQGYDQNYNQGYDQNYNQGYDQSYNQGYDQSYSQGYDQSNNGSYSDQTWSSDSLSSTGSTYSESNYNYQEQQQFPAMQAQPQQQRYSPNNSFAANGNFPPANASFTRSQTYNNFTSSAPIMNNTGAAPFQQRSQTMNVIPPMGMGMPAMNAQTPEFRQIRVIRIEGGVATMEVQTSMVNGIIYRSVDRLGAFHKNLKQFLSTSSFGSKFTVPSLPSKPMFGGDSKYCKVLNQYFVDIIRNDDWPRNPSLCGFFMESPEDIQRNKMLIMQNEQQSYGPKNIMYDITSQR